ncbi:MAG: ABC transporter ATP-binding protein [Candidatus Margulisbacteria bacterium]|nr:ABC transporter ATP-binding protein [Candidatus Margulisiibacteriota bacterium]
MPSIVTAKDLTKKFADLVAVDSISFEIKEGECFGFLGPNGAGKTTTIRMIHCVSPKTSGELKVAGLDAGVDNREIKMLLGVIPQELNLDEDLTTYENLVLFAEFFGINRQEAQKRVLELLEFVELKNKMNNRIEELSTGMKRRLQIARALINQPKLIIADEPTTGLDPQARHLIWQRLRELKRRGVSMVLTTQYMEEAEQLCDEIVIMHQGKIIRQGMPSELIEEEFGGEMIEVKDSKDRVYRRPATLEDVFLKLTGRQIIE